MGAIRKLISVWTLALAGSLLLPLVSVAALSGTTYDAPPSTTTTAPATIVKHTVAVNAVPIAETGFQSMASGQARSLLAQISISVAPNTVDPRTLQRTEQLTGRASSRSVKNLTESMKSGGWKGDPIDVVQHNGKNYIIDGHHRVAAAKRAGIEVPIRVVDDVAAHPSSWMSVEEAVNDAAYVLPDKLR